MVNQKIYGKKAVEWRFLSPIDFCQPEHTALPTTKTFHGLFFFFTTPPLKERVYFVKFTPPRGGNSPGDYRGPFFVFFLPPFKKK